MTAMMRERSMLMVFHLIVAGLIAASAASDAHAATPRALPDLPGLYQRILVLPDAVLRTEPKDGAPVARSQIPAFTVLYVYDCQPTDCSQWLQVGARADGKTEGWIAVAQAQDWRSMLVMQYAPRGQRGRVLMFKDEAPLAQLIDATDGAARARALLADAEGGRADPARVIAIEPKEAVNPREAFYVMPVLGWKSARFPDDTPAHLLQIASVNRKAPPLPTPRAPDKPPGRPPFKVGVAFVLDTTISMGPYLERTKLMVREFYRALEADGTADRVDLAVVGYRTAAERDPRLEFTTRIFHPLDPKAPRSDLFFRLGEVREAKVPSPGWDEDAFAGLYAALNELDWSPYAARLLVLVTDSGAIRGNNQLARNPAIDIDNIVEIAERKRIAAFPLYLLTPQGDRLGNRARARAQWHALGRTGDPTRDKYVEIGAGSVDVFGRALDGFATTLAASVKRLAADAAAPPHPTPVPAAPDDVGAAIGQSVINELFRAQAEYLGNVAGTPAPSFFRAWASDRDLVNPSFAALQVRVFLTRNQLSGLGASLSAIVEQAKRASLSPENFFDDLQSLSATMSGDPNRQGSAGAFTDIRNSNLLPSYLRALPYRSKVLRMTQELWLSFGLSGQQEFIDELEFKLRSYRDIASDVGSWIDPGAGDRGGDIYPVPLDVLP